MDDAANFYDLYRDIQARTGGEIYIGVVGPVRTGKSTFIKRFMEEMVFPNMTEGPNKTRALDELPQSAGGKTITTTEPKFIPNEAAEICLGEDTIVKVRLIDCVGYMVDGAAGHLEDNQERMVKTPWFEQEIPFTKAAQIGTDKVMRDHCTIGLVVTNDGSVVDIPRAGYEEAEAKTVEALKQSGKPFLMLLNSKKPYSEEAKQLSLRLKEKYRVNVMNVNCEQLKKEDIHKILKNLLYEFPISAMEFYLPKWFEMLDYQHDLKQKLIASMKEMFPVFHKMEDVMMHPIQPNIDFVRKTKTDLISLADGCVKVVMDIDDRIYYEMISHLLDEDISDEEKLFAKLKELAVIKTEYDKVSRALEAVKMKGYGVVTPDREEIRLDSPEIIRHSNKYGVKIKALSPSIHMIRANIETEIAPIVGTKEQADDLITYIQNAQAQNDIWNTNIFGKTIEQLVEDGITAKIAGLGEESQLKLQDTMQKIVNDNNGGMVCIII